MTSVQECFLVRNVSFLLHVPACLPEQLQKPFFLLSDWHSTKTESEEGLEDVVSIWSREIEDRDE